MTLAVSGGGLANDGALNVIGATASFTGGASANNAGAEINAINATLTFTPGLTNNGDLNLINTNIVGSVASTAGGSATFVGSNSIGGDLTMSPADALFIDIAGTAPADFDMLMVDETAMLAGTLNVSLSGGFAPSLGDTFGIVTGLGGFGGAFATLNLPALNPGLQWQLNPGGATLFLNVVAADLTADFDGDGDVDGDDLDQWQGDFAVNGMSDSDGDGDSDGADFLAWQRQFGASAFDSAVGAVPEPNLHRLLLFGLPAIAFRLGAGRRVSSTIPQVKIISDCLGRLRAHERPRQRTGVNCDHDWRPPTFVG
jgi:hypothetical protein